MQDYRLSYLSRIIGKACLLNLVLCRCHFGSPMLTPPLSHMYLVYERKCQILIQYNLSHWSELSIHEKAYGISMSCKPYDSLTPHFYA